MKISAFTRWLAACSLTSIVLWWASLSISGVAAMEKASNAPGSDPRLEMVTALQALGPYPSLGDQATVFGRFVGVWDGEYTEFSRDGKTTHSSRETRWSFDDIRPDSWVFRDEETRDGGKTWRLQSEYHMKRRGVAPPAL